MRSRILVLLSLDILPELSKIDNSAPKNAVRNSSRNMTIDIPFFSVNQYEPMVEWLRLVVDSLEKWLRFPHGAESFCHIAAILRGTEPVMY